MPPSTGDVASAAPEGETTAAAGAPLAATIGGADDEAAKRSAGARARAAGEKEGASAAGGAGASNRNDRKDGASALAASNAAWHHAFDAVPEEAHAAERAHDDRDRAHEDHPVEHALARASHHDADRTPLPDARAFAKAHQDDPHALKVWATAAYRAGALREARRAADVWALHDGTAEPRLFLANVLDAGGHRGDAKAVLEEWLEIHPESVEARRMHARLGAALPPPETTSHKSLAQANHAARD
jgi:hypothetical protein